MLYVHTESLEFADQFLDLALSRVSTHVSDVFVGFAAKDEEDRPRHPVGDCNFGFVCRPEPELQSIIFGSVK